ncbi:hypothetical protein M3Y94_00681800 [Aphelenchoides besseyi]|nr:hypothetical protein M3Y94_00681800 [Aphelenchoides besseyi]
MTNSSYKAESGNFNLHLTADGKLQMGDNTVVCANIKFQDVFSSNGLKYYAITQDHVKNFSVAIKGKDIDPRIISQILTTTTNTVPPTTTTSGAETIKIHSCQSHAYEIKWTENTTLNFTYSADVTKDTKFDVAIDDENCSLSITSVKDDDSYLLNYRSYKAESGSFNLHLTEDGKLQMGDNTVVCANVTIEKAFASNGVKYYAITQDHVKNFSVAIKGEQVAVKVIPQILTTTTTTTVSPTTSAAVPIVTTTKNEEETNYRDWICGVVGLLFFLLVLSSIGGSVWRRRIKKRRKREEAARRKAQQEKKAETKVEQKLTARQMRGKIVPGLPPLGPPGWEPDQIPANKFKHMGPLKWELNPPANLAQELDNDDSAPFDSNQQIV